MLNKREIKVIKLQLKKEQKVLDDLERQYKKAWKDIGERIRLLQSDELTQSRIYQIQYQKALRRQVEAILDKLQGDEYATIQQYLHDSYQDGFIGTMYSIHGQGIPLIVPLDQQAAVNAIVTDSKLQEDLYTELGVNIKQLKKAITQEITRGIATNMPFADIARNIANRSKAPLSRAKTIVRTESHRINCQAAYDAAVKAKQDGADIVLQWDATTDKKTRSSHARLDGQIVEVGERFANGLLYPGDSAGDAADVVNCRCVALTRARWALDEAELAQMKERAKFFGLDKSDDFEDFERKYLKAAEPLKNQGKSGIISTGAKGALTSKNDPKYKKRDAHAKRYYEAVRNSDKQSIVNAIAANTGIERDVVERMITHLFYTKHELENGLDYFASDYHISESVRRLRSNVDIMPHDLTLIRHEAYESELMATGLSFEEAHEIAQKKYNYKRGLLDFLKANGLE